LVLGCSEMGKYGDAAILAIEYFTLSRADSPIAAWRLATQKIFEGGAAQKKSCPKGAFLGLCEEGVVKGVPRDNYTRSKDNKAYALAAWRALRSEPALVHDQNRLWSVARGSRNIRHNEQMDVVTALWRRGLLRDADR
jgi:hypothetical protein